MKRGQRNRQKQPSSKTPTETQVTDADVRCTVLCKDRQGKKNSKIYIVDMTQRGNSKTLRGYVLVDDQASRTLINECVPEFFEGENPHNLEDLLTLKTLLGCKTLPTRKMTGLSVRGVYSNKEIKLPTAFTCEQLVDTREEYATRVYLNSYAHTIPYACEFPPYDP